MYRRSRSYRARRALSNDGSIGREADIPNASRPKKSDRIIANGIGIRYRFDGPADAPVILFSHSLASGLEMWDAQAAAFVGDYRVLRYDIRGHGGSEVTLAPYGLEVLVADVHGLIQSLGVERVHFVGLSLGGMIGQLFALAHPERLDRLVLCDTASEMPDPEMWAERVRIAEKDGLAALAAPTLARWFTPAFHKTRPGEVARIRDLILRTPVDGYVGACRAIAGLDATARLKEIVAPTLCIVGDRDETTPPAAARAIRDAIPGAELVLLDHAAHLSNIEQAAAFNAALAGFLARG